MKTCSNYGAPGRRVQVLPPGGLLRSAGKCAEGEGQFAHSGDEKMRTDLIPRPIAGTQDVVDPPSSVRESYKTHCGAAPWTRMEKWTHAAQQMSHEGLEMLCSVAVGTSLIEDHPLISAKTMFPGSAPMP